MKLPNGHRAIIDVERKLIGYCLNSSHRTGKNKARVFQKVLGYNAGNADILAKALQLAAREGEAKIKERTSDAAKYEVLFWVDGLKGKVLVLSGWIIESGTQVPRLTTCYVKPKG